MGNSRTKKEEHQYDLKRNHRILVLWQQIISSGTPKTKIHKNPMFACFFRKDMGVSTNSGTPKWMVKIMENLLIHG